MAKDKSTASGWDEVEETDATDVVEIDSSAPIVEPPDVKPTETDSVGSAEAVAGDGTPSGEAKAKRVANFNGLTTGMYAAMRKSGQTPAKRVGEVATQVAAGLAARSEAVTDESLNTAIASKLAEDASDTGVAYATWWTNVSAMAKRRIYNIARKGITSPVAETPAE